MKSNENGKRDLRYLEGPFVSRGTLRIQAPPPVYEGLQIMSLTSPRARGVSRARRPGAQINANQSLTN